MHERSNEPKVHKEKELLVEESKESEDADEMRVYSPKVG